MSRAQRAVPEEEARRGRRSRRAAPSRWALGLLGAAIAISALGIGAVHVGVLAIVAACSSGAVCATLLAKRDRSFVVPAPALVCFALAAFTYVQAFPIPHGILAWIAPSTADVWDRALLPFREPGPRWASLSLDPGASRVEALRWLVYGQVVLVAAAVGRDLKTAYVLAAVYLSALLVALSTVLHGLLGATHVFGVYAPRHTPLPWRLGPLMNPNNLAGYLNLGAFCGMGLVLTKRSPLPKWVVLVGQAAILGCDLLSASRGGLVALFLGFPLLFLLLWRNGKRAGDGTGKAGLDRAAWVLAGSMGGGVLFAALAFQPETWRELYDKDLSKLRMVSWAKPMIADHPWLGIGRGAFESVFPAYRTIPGNVTYTHIENFPTQWAVEWGLPVAMAAIVAFIWAFRPSRAGTAQSRLAAAGWVGGVVLLLQNLVDLGLEIPALSLAAFAVFGALFGEHAARTASGRGLRLHLVRWPAIAACTAAAILLAVPPGLRDVSSERDRFYDDMKTANFADPPTRRSIRAELRGAMLRHPAESFFALLGAVVAFEGGDDNPMPWLERSLERASVNGGAHFVLAQVLAKAGARSQALLELRLAVVGNQDLANEVALFATRWARGLDELLAAVPDGEAGVPMLQILGTVAPLELRKPVLVEAVRRDPDRAELHEFLAGEELRQLQEAKSSGACDASCIARQGEKVEIEARELRRLLPSRSTAERMLAELMSLRGNPEEGEKLLASRCKDVEDRLRCLVTRAQIASHIPGTEPFATAARELGVSCNLADECADISALLGDLFSARQEWGQALTHRHRACEAKPNADCWLRVAEAASHAGAHVQAADAFDRAYKLGGRVDASLKEQGALERSKALGMGL